MKIYTHATERLKQLHRDFVGLKSGRPDTAIFFDNIDHNEQTGNFNAQTEYYDYMQNGYTLVNEEKFIEIVCPQTSVFNPQKHYDNSNGSLYKVATERGWNAYIFDVVKRLERGGKKDPLKQEIEKSIDVLRIWLNELT